MTRKEKTQYPEWAEKCRTPGTAIKKIRGKLYLYRRVTSVRVEGKKNPQPRYEYLGAITENGLIPPRKERIDTSEAEVREFGFSFALRQLCPESWKVIQGPEWEARLAAVTLARSKNTYLRDSEEEIKTLKDLRVQPGVTVSSLNRKLKEERGVTLDELQDLDTIYLITMDGRKIISRASASQKELLERLGIRLEA